MHHPTDVEHWLEREIAQWVHHEGSITPSVAPRADALTTGVCDRTEIGIVLQQVQNNSQMINKKKSNKR